MEDVEFEACSWEDLVTTLEELSDLISIQINGAPTGEFSSICL